MVYNPKSKNPRQKLTFELDMKLHLNVDFGYFSEDLSISQKIFTIYFLFVLTFLG